MRVFLNRTEFSRTISDINEKIENIANYIKQLEYIISEEIPNCWVGDDSTRYVSFMNEVSLKKYQEMKSLLDEYSQYLNGIPGVYDRLDENFSCKSIGI